MIFVMFVPLQTNVELKLTMEPMIIPITIIVPPQTLDQHNYKEFNLDHFLQQTIDIQIPVSLLSYIVSHFNNI